MIIYKNYLMKIMHLKEHMNRILLNAMQLLMFIIFLNYKIFRI